MVPPSESSDSPLAEPPGQAPVSRFSRVWQPDLDRLEQSSVHPVAPETTDEAHPDLPSTLRSGRAWLAYLVVGGVAIAVYQLLPRGIVQDVAYVALGLCGVAAILIGVRLHRPVRALPWYLMGAGQLIWICGDIKSGWDGQVAHIEVFPSIADGFYVAAYPILAAGLLALSRGRRQRGDISGLLDSVIVTAGIGVLSWVLLARRAIANSGESVTATAVAVAYPLGDMLLLAMLVRFLTIPGARTASLRLLLTAVGLLVAADTAASALSLLTYSSTGAIDFLWLASYVVWGASALHPSIRTLSKPTLPQAHRFSPARLVALTCAVLVAPGTLVVHQLAGLPPNAWTVVVSSVVMSLLVVARG